MAEKLLHYDFTKTVKTPSEGRRSYPWDEWLDGSIWRIEQGTDFDTHPLMMERIVRTRATTRKVKVNVRHDSPTSLVFQAVVPKPQVAKRPTRLRAVS